MDYWYIRVTAIHETSDMNQLLTRLLNYLLSANLLKLVFVTQYDVIEQMCAF